MSGIAVALQSTLQSLHENKNQVEMYLAFGATKWEAARPIVTNALRLALLPTINSMSIIGLISIPGMMTGQILGGTPVSDAVRYQEIIMFMITAACCLSSIVCVLIAVMICFDSDHCLRAERITKTKSFTWPSLF